LKEFESFQKMKRFSLSPSLSAQSVFFFFLFHLAAQNSFPRPRNFLPAGPFPRLLAQPAQRPLPLPDSPPGRPRLSGASSSPTEPDSGSSPTWPRARRRVPLGPARPGPCSAPIKGTLDPLETPNRSRSCRLRKKIYLPRCRHCWSLELQVASLFLCLPSTFSPRRSFASR